MRCIPAGSQIKCIVSILVIFTVLLSVDGYIIRPVWGAESEINEIVFSLDVRDKPLSGVLRTIYEQTGFNFSVTESAKNVPVTISLSKAPLLEGLNRVIKSTGINSHAVVFDSSKNISIIILDRSNFTSNTQEKLSGSESIQGARADQSHLAVSDKNTIASPPFFPPVIPIQGARADQSRLTVSNKDTIASPPPPPPPLQSQGARVDQSRLPVSDKDMIASPWPPPPTLQRR